MSLSDKDKNQIIDLIKAGQKLPKEFIYKLFADEEDVFLFWNGRKVASLYPILIGVTTCLLLSNSPGKI
jgi:hypothetical protein